MTDTDRAAPRRELLLLAAAEALGDGRDPLSTSFLVEHEVTADECFELAEDLELGARILIEIWRDLARGGQLAIVATGQLAGALLARDRRIAT